MEPAKELWHPIKWIVNAHLVSIEYEVPMGEREKDASLKPEPLHTVLEE
jgi:hypothetical protein